MTLLLIRLWPALIPLLVYFWWHRKRVRQHASEGKEIPGFFDGPWMTACFAALLIAVVMFLVMGLLEPRRNNMAYTPAHLENGKIIKGEMRKK